MRRLLIDANIYLAFYRLTTDDLDELKKLAALVQGGELELYLTQQIRDEVTRNRERVLDDSLKAARDAKLPTAYPQILRNYAGFASLDAARRDYSERLNTLVERAKEDAANRTLHADRVLKDLFDKATDLKVTSEAVAAARTRADVGNPPGKPGSLGDAITWELMLKHHPGGEDLYLITGDTDFASPLRPGHLGQFLEEEWGDVKCSAVRTYRTMTAFFRELYPAIKLSEETEVQLAIERLVASANFAATHAAIASLSAMTDFTDSQVVTMVAGSLANNQVAWILGDPDVREFFERILKYHAHALSPEHLTDLRQRLDEVEE